MNHYTLAATLIGIEAPSAALNLELKPYAISRLSTEQLHSAGLRLERTQQDLQEGGFPRTVRPHQSDELARAHLEGDVSENGLVCVAEREAGGTDEHFRVWARARGEVRRRLSAHPGAQHRRTHKRE